MLIEGISRLLNSYSEKLSAKALYDLRKLGVQVILNNLVQEITKAYV